MKGFLFFSIITLALFVALFAVQAANSNDGKLHIIFCDVGQGDAVLIRTPNGSDMLFDGGPNKKVLSCLSNHLPFWDRNIELMFLSHPHADHLIGLIDVLERYSLDHFATEDLANDTAEYRALFGNLQKENVSQKRIVANDRFRTPDGVSVTVVGPTREFLDRTKGSGIINSKEFASLILDVKYKDFDVLLTGDSQAGEVEEAIENMGKVDVLQVPHHGSKTGLNLEIVTKLRPKVAVISVGKNNYGHPSKEAIELLNNEERRILRTDREGDIEIVTDGKRWEVR